MRQMEGQVSLYGPGTWSGKTCPEPLAATEGKISGRYSRKQYESSIPMPLYLDLQKGHGGLLGPLWETGGPLPGEYSTHSFGECPSAAAESRLSWILEEEPHPKYFLSAKACRGILRRAQRRGKELPQLLREALILQSHTA